MRAVLFWAATGIAAAILISFAVSNLQAVALSLWPLPDKVWMPLYLVVFAVLVLGFLLGGLAAWAGRHRLRRELRQRRRRIEALERELAATQAQLDRADAAARPAVPARP